MQSVGRPDTRRQTLIPCLHTIDSLVIERWQGIGQSERHSAESHVTHKSHLMF